MWPFIRRGSLDVSNPRVMLIPKQQDGLNQLRRCVLKVYQRYVDQGSPEGRKTLSRAFAICTSQLQKYGYLAPGTRIPTSKGLLRSMKKSSDPEHVERMLEYERVLEKARKPKPAHSPVLEKLYQQATRQIERRSSTRLRGAASRVCMGPFVSDFGSANRMGAGELWTTAIALQRSARQVFSCDTAFGDCDLDKPSRGHCLLASMLLQDLVGGHIREGSVDGIPHYWNRVRGFDVDLTAGQFGDRGMVIDRGPLYGKSREFPRSPGKLLAAVANNNEANAMYLLFSQRARAQAKQNGYGDFLEVR